MQDFTLAHTISVILLLNIVLLIVTYVGLYDGRPTTCDPKILSLPNLRVVLQKGLRCIGRCVGLLPTFLLSMYDVHYVNVMDHLIFCGANHCNTFHIL